MTSVIRFDQDGWCHLAQCAVELGSALADPKSQSIVHDFHVCMLATRWQGEQYNRHSGNQKQFPPTEIFAPIANL